MATQLTDLARLAPADGAWEHEIVLYAADTQNTWKVATLLEELGVAYDVFSIDISTNVQKEPWYTKMNPNGRTPTLLDRSAGTGSGYSIFESGAILLYLCRKFDSASRFLPADPLLRSEVEQWLIWQARPTRCSRPLRTVSFVAVDVAASVWWGQPPDPLCGLAASERQGVCGVAMGGSHVPGRLASGPADGRTDG